MLAFLQESVDISARAGHAAGIEAVQQHDGSPVAVWNGVQAGRHGSSFRQPVATQQGHGVRCRIRLRSDQGRTIFLTLLTFRGSLSDVSASWQRRAESSEGQHRDGDHGLGRVESERQAGVDADAGVDRFDPRVGQVVGERVADRVVVAGGSTARLRRKLRCANGWPTRATGPTASSPCAPAAGRPA